MRTVIEVEGVRKRYGAHVALDGISLSIDHGEIFGILGPNGAGKTTLVECITGLRRPDGGSVRVLGLDPQRDGTELKNRVGVQLQQGLLPSRLTVREAVRLYAAFYSSPRQGEPLLQAWGLADKVDTPFDKLSGGQKQRLFIALALINRPEVVVLDELTTGLDPHARRVTWAAIEQIRTEGTTVLLVTHFMEEAEHLCDRVAVVDSGKLVALDSPAGLLNPNGDETRIRFSAPSDFDPTVLERLPGVGRVTRAGRDIVVAGNGSLMAEVATALAGQGLAPPDIRTERATLDDVFLTLTGAEKGDQPVS